MRENNSTIEYYNRNAEAYASDTVNVDFSLAQNRFLSYIQSNGSILDFGCGSGRDSKYFKEKGFIVDAIDGSEELCKIAEAHTGIKVKCMLFQELDEVNKYDGVWACSSILHLTREDLKTVFQKMINSLKNDGIIYTSFKYSNYEGERNGRYFIDFTEDSFDDFIKGFSDIEIIDEWITSDVRTDRKNERWLNLILRKR